MSCARRIPYFLPLSTTDARWNLATEQVVFDELASHGDDFFLLWQNASAVIVGKNQNTVAEVNLPFAEAQNIPVVRRLSGGGAVYHDLGNLNFTFVTQNPEGTAGIDFGRFCEPILQALRSLGVPAELSGRNDMTLAGRKFSGNAQYQKQGRTMHHGTLLFDSNLSVVEQVLHVPSSDEKLRGKGIPSVRSRVTNIAEHLPRPMTLDAFQERLVEFLFPCDPPVYTLTETENDVVRQLVEARYDTWAWNIGRQMTFDIRRRQRFEPCGTIEVSLNIRDGQIADIVFQGDFFGNRDIAELQALLRGTPRRNDALQAVLAQVPIEEYFHGLDSEALLSLLR